MNMMSDDAKAIVLLCGRLGTDSDMEPLQQSEYTRIVRWLLSKDMRPSDLLEPENVAPAATGSGIPEGRLTGLLKRGVQLGFAVETWNRSNIWVICRSDPDYPARYKSHLKDKAPPIFFGVGERSLLQGGGLAIVGSRNIDAEAEDFTREAAEWCARGRLPVVSGGARGVDQIAMKGALDAGGCVVGVLAENLLKNSVSREARKAIADDRLLLISPYHPEARFTVGTAMARNKLIYAMADYGLVISSDHNKGGTWAGATEELKRKPGRPVFVRTTGSVPAGNRKLLELGALPFPEITPTGDPAATLQGALKGQPEQPAEDLFAYATKGGPPVAQVRESTTPEQDAPATTPLRPSASSAVDHSAPATIYDAVLPVIVAALDKPVSADDLAKRLDVAKGQLQKWLKQAVTDKKIKKLTKPVRYQRKN
jgi:predicted Rossmann fold nucleotide-binding protein DprA/Smf involved in DNA uptake